MDKILTLVEQWQKDDPAGFEHEFFILDFTEKVCEIMEQKGITPKDLAQKMHVKVSDVNSWLDGDNILLTTISEIFYHLGYRAKIEVEEI